MINFKGHEKFPEVAKFLRKYPDKISKVATAGRDAAIETVSDMLIDASPIDTGNFLSSWTNVKTKTGASFKNTAPYARVLEKGLYPRVTNTGKTVAVGDRVYSSQAVGGIIGPLKRDQERLAIIADVFVTAMLNAVKGIKYE